METKQQRKVRLGLPMRSAGDWEEAALDTMAAGGIRSLAIPALATTLGVTKGSFYWHFESLEALIAASLRRWEAADREVIEELGRIADPKARLKAAFGEATRGNRAHALYVTLGVSDDAAVTNVLRRVSRRRIRFLAGAFEDMGRKPAEARTRALLAYTAYLGMIHLKRQAFEGLRAARDVEAYAAHAARTLIPT
jgi:AcrR family transcriptional regulator